MLLPLQHTALQGVDLGRPLGHWFGPNNVAQVIKYGIYLYLLIWIQLLFLEN